MSRWTARDSLRLAAAMGVAASLVAGCRETPGEGARDIVRSDGRAEAATPLAYEWLLAPTAEQKPPLAAPLALTVDPERDRLLILEAVPPEVRVHDLRSGKFLRSLGRPGSGPGEYRYPRAMATNDAGTTAVLSLNGRVTFWGHDFDLLGTRTTGTGLAGDVVASVGDTFIVKTDIFPPDDVSEFRRVTPGAVSPEPFYRDHELPGIEQNGLPFRNHSYAVATSGDGRLLLAPPGPEYVILAVDAGGRAVAHIARPDVPPLHRSEDEMEELREAVVQGFTASGHAPPARVPIPPHRAHVRRMERSPEGQVWALTGRGDKSAALIDVFDADGDHLVTYLLELATVDLAVTRSAVYLLGESEDGIPGVAMAKRPDVARRLAAE